MVNEDSINESELTWNGFLRPRHESYSFGNLIGACRGLLTGTAHKLPLKILADPSGHKKYRKIILIIADGLGWELLHKTNGEILSAVKSVSGAQLSRLTAVFPSSTTPSLIKFHSDRGPLETGIVDWTYYENTVQRVICPIINSSAKQAFGKYRVPNTLMRSEVDVLKILKPHEIYHSMAKQGIDVQHYFPHLIYSSNFSIWATNGFAKGYEKLEDAFNETLIKRSHHQDLSLTTIYLSQIDSISHSKGPFSDETLATTGEFLQKFLEFIRNAKDVLSDALILLTADHGQMPTNNNIFLDEICPELLGYLQKDANNEPVLPCGSSRALFVNVESRFFKDATDLLSGRIGEFSKIVPLSDLLKNGIFGQGEPGNAFIKNTGKICIFPNDSYGIFWNMDGMYDENLKGAHGGLSREELHIPLFAIQY